MGTYPPPGAGAGRRIDELIERIELELRQALAYVNDAVVPQVRQESISAMRKVADKLHGLANRMETQTPPSEQPPSNKPPGGPLT